MLETLFWSCSPCVRIPGILCNGDIPMSSQYIIVDAFFTFLVFGTQAVSTFVFNPLHI